MSSLNKVIVMGNLGQDPELRYTQSQLAVTNISLATTEYRKTETGESKELTEWHRITLFGKQAENVCKYLKKGSKALVEGRLQTRSWEAEDGTKRYATDIIGNNIQFLSAPNQDQAQKTAPVNQSVQTATIPHNAPPIDNNDVPF